MKRIIEIDINNIRIYNVTYIDEIRIVNEDIKFHTFTVGMEINTKNEGVIRIDQLYYDNCLVIFVGYYIDSRMSILPLSDFIEGFELN